MNEIPAGTTQLFYRRPRLTVYGDLRSITLTSLTDNMNDKTNSSTSMT